MNSNPAEWIQAVWPIALGGGAVIWYIAKSSNHSARISRLEGKSDEHDIRLAAGEVTIVNQGRSLDRIESKLDRLLEARIQK